MSIVESSPTASPRVVAVIVTYAQRAPLCMAASNAALAAGAEHVLLIDNASPENNRVVLEQYAHDLHDVVRLISLGRNSGSAGGYRAGIEHARTLDPTHIWLLDDDNIPRPESLKRLIRLAADGALDVVTAYRPTRPYQRRLVEGQAAATVFPSKSSFLYFDAWQTMMRMAQTRRIAERRPPRLVPDRATAGPIEMPYGPYGGTLLSVGILDVIGLPTQEFWVYEDDTEYLHRVVRQGGRILLAPTAIVEDADPNWLSQASGSTGPARLLTSESSKRVFYGVRNRVFFETRFYAASRFRLVTNALTYSTVLAALSLKHRRVGRLLLILRAIVHGIRGDLKTGLGGEAL